MPTISLNFSLDNKKGYLQIKNCRLNPKVSPSKAALSTIDSCVSGLFSAKEISNGLLAKKTIFRFKLDEKFQDRHQKRAPLFLNIRNMQTKVYYALI